MTVPSRRKVLQGILAVPVVGFAASHDLDARELLATPECADADDPTPPQGAGPFYKPRSPRRQSFLEPGLGGTRLLVTGRVVTTRCKALPGALLDFWHCDSRGEYDAAGFRFRGHQFTDNAGAFSLETLLPAAYSARTPHIHVRVQPAGGSILTTALYLSEQANSRDGLFHPALVMELAERGGVRHGVFRFVLPASSNQGPGD